VRGGVTARLVDSHCHLQADAFAGDLDEVVSAAEAAGVERMLVPGWDVASSLAAIEIAGRYRSINAAVGVHPHAAANVDDAEWRVIVEQAANPAVVAIGETGLDYDRGFSPREAQLANLRRHLHLALDTGLPAILHCRSAPGRRDAQDDLLAELRAAGVGGPASHAAFGNRPPAVLHSFSGPADYAEAALDLGLAVGFGGLVFRRGEESSAEVARLVPGARLLVETDAPYLAPPGAPRRRNAPEWVRVTAAWVAGVRAAEPDALGGALVEAYDRLFRKARMALDRPADNAVGVPPIAG
jgi:TatD DNase family protein